MRTPRILAQALFLATLLLAPFAFVGPAVADVPGLDARLTSRIRARLTKAGITKGRYGVAVIERGPSGRVVCFDGQAAPLIPASVAKVLATASALEHLGPGHQFVTRVTARGSLDRGVLDGDLVVHGSGDPTLSMDDLRALAAQVRGSLTRVTGDLVLDDGALDRAYTHPDWPAGDLRHAYGAGVGGLSLGESCLVLKATGTRAGSAATLSFPRSSGVWTVVNKIKTTAGGRAALGGTWVKDKLTAGGKVPAGKSSEIRVPVPDPVLFFGGALVDALRRAGVRVTGRIRAASRAADRNPGTEIARTTSDLGPALRNMNLTSRNAYASTLFKLAGSRLSGVGTWQSGTDAVTRMAEGRGIAAGGTRVVDGSGLSPTNRITAGLLAQVLQSFDQDPLRGSLLLRSLPTSGVDGTLRRRLGSRGLKGRVHAKTGTLNDTRVRSLAGYIDAKGGRPGVVFAILLNGRGANHAIIDDLVREIDQR